MIRRGLTAAAWTACILGCTAILHLAQNLKWPASGDRYREMDRAAMAIRPMISADSVLSLCASDVPEELIVYLRYCLIPARVQLLPKKVTGKALLIAGRSRMATASAPLRESQPSPALLWHYEDAHAAFELLQF